METGMKRMSVILFIALLAGCGRSSGFDSLASDFSSGVPEYQNVESFTHPVDAVKGDYFSADLKQSPEQFKKLVSKPGVTEFNALSAAGVTHISVGLKTNPKYPWFLSIKTELIDRNEKYYRVHLEGRQPFD